MKFSARLVFFFFGFLLVIGLSCNSKTSNTDDVPIDQKPVDTVVTNDGGGTVDTPKTMTPLVFTAIGDVPYGESQRDDFISLVEKHNATDSNSRFIMHVGDIKPGAEPCVEAIFKDVSGLLKNFDTPTFIVLGDNEYNDCENPKDALQLWNEYFLDFHENWDEIPTVEVQEERSENFAWVENGVLLVGLNIVGSKVHDEAEWEKRLTDDANWVRQQLNLHGDTVTSAVFFGHANMIEAGSEKFKIFTDRFRKSAKEFDKPVLFMQGDGHFWIADRPWDEQNIMRVQVEGGASAVQVTVDSSLEDPFVFDRTFLD